MAEGSSGEVSDLLANERFPQLRLMEEHSKIVKELGAMLAEEVANIGHYPAPSRLLGILVRLAQAHAKMAAVVAAMERQRLEERGL